MKTQDPDIKLYSDFIKNLSITTDLFNDRMTKHLAGANLTIAQFGMMNYLFEQSCWENNNVEGIRLTDLTKAVEVQQPAVTKAVAKFVKLSLVDVHSDKSDKRTRLIAITSKGKDTVIAIRKIFYTDFCSLSLEWKNEELNDFGNALSKLSAWLEKNRL